MAASAELQLLIKARDDASKILGKSQSSIKKFGKAAGMALAGMGVAAAGAGIAMAKMAMDFESNMGEVATLVPNMSKEAFGTLSKDILQFSKDVGIATSEAVPALYQAISAGVPPDNVIDFMNIAAKAAIGGVTDLETAVDGLSSVVNSYGADVITAQESADLMFTAVKLGKTNFEELSRSLFQVVPTAASLGMGFDQVAAAMAVMTAQGVPTSVAATQLRQALVEASKGGTMLSDTIVMLSGKTMRELIAEGGNVVDILEMVRQSGDITGMEFTDLFGSVEAMNAALALTGPNYSKVTAAMDEMAASAGAVNGAYDTIADTASFKFDKAMNSLKVQMTEIGLAILPHVSEAVIFLQDKFDDLGVWFDENRPAIERAINQIADTVVALWATFQSGIEVVWPLIKGLFNFIISNKPVLVAVIVAIGVAIFMALGPVSQAAAAITGMVLLIGWFRDNWREIWAAVVGAFRRAGEFLERIYKSKLGWLLPAGPLIKALLFLKDNWRDIWDSMRRTLSRAIDLIQSAMGRLIQFFRGVGVTLGKIFEPIAQIIVAPFQAAIGMVKAAWNTMADAFNSVPTFSVPSWVPGMGGKSFGLPNMPHLQRGGFIDAPPSTAVPAILHGGELIVPFDRATGGRGFGGNVSFTAIFPRLLGDRRAVKEDLAAWLMQLQREGRLAPGTVS